MNTRFYSEDDVSFSLGQERCITFENDKFSGHYDSEKDQWVLYVKKENIGDYPVEIRMDPPATVWVVDSMEFCPETNDYEIILRRQKGTKDGKQGKD